jgi:hypothetical protein
MKHVIILLVLTLTSSNLYAQELKLEKTFFGYKFVQNDTTLKLKEVYKRIQSNYEAYDVMKKAKMNNTMAAILGFAGGGMIGWSIGEAISGKDFNWTLFGVGATITIVSIPISIKSIKDAKRAVTIYNSSLNKTAYMYVKPEIKMVFSGSGFGISMSF